MNTTLNRGALLLLIPAIAVFLLLLVSPLANILFESFRLFEPGRVGAAPGAPFTLLNYTELLKPAYALYFYDTFRISLIATIVGLMIGYPIAYYIARQRTALIRKLGVGFLIAMMFLSVLVRVYAIALTFGPVGFLRQITALTGLSPNSVMIAQIMIVAGLLHYVIPISALTLVGTIQNVNPRLAEAAQALGAPRWLSHLTVTLPLSIRGILSAFLICYTLSIAAFVMPMVLGKGQIYFVSNLIYARFGEVANYPSGSALSMIMLVLSLVIIYLVTRVASTGWDTD